MNADIIKQVQEMGYVKCIAKKSTPNYYKLDDGSIIEIQYTVNYLIPTGVNGKYSVNMSATVSIFIPKDNRHPEKFLNYFTIRFGN